MRTLARPALAISVTAAFLVGCGGSQRPMGGLGTMPQALAPAGRTASTNYNVLYSFGVPPDGSDPRGSLIDVGGVLYGTTRQGGSYLCGYSTSKNYCGTVFSITTDGIEKVLYRFSAPPDGDEPWASLLDVGGTLYGTTREGGSKTCGYQSYFYGCGTVFSITTSGAERVLHSFGSQNDGVAPVASLIAVNGKLYGTTVGGGTHSCGLYTGACGTVFRITRRGTENVLHSFRHFGHPHFPLGSLIDAGGTLYGTTEEGGRYNCREASGCGTVFSMTPRGTVKVLHEFGEGSDGARPTGSLIELDGTFYGTTGQGGVHGLGTVFSITAAGKEKVLYSFGGSPDGRYPNGDLIEANGILYGTTGGGGVYCNPSGGCGTVFAVTTRGAENVLHSFGGTVSDGAIPHAGLTDVNGTLYGTTTTGGANSAGTVFALTP